MSNALDCSVDPGVYPDMPMEDYHTAGGVSSTLIRECEPTLAHGLAYLREPYQDDGFNEGTAVHTAVLEPEQFSDVYDNQKPEGANDLHHYKRKTARRLGGGETVSEVAEAIGVSAEKVREYCEIPAVQRLRVWYQHNDPAEIVETTPHQLDRVKRARDAVFDHPRAKEILSEGDAEVSHFWEDAPTGLICRCRPDFLTSQRDMVDLKTFGSAGERSFAKQIGRSGYHAQAAFYLDGVAGSGGPRCEYFFLIVVDLELAAARADENAVMVYRLGADSIARGRDIYRARLDELGRWHRGEITEPGYSTQIETIEAPEWA